MSRRSKIGAVAGLALAVATIGAWPASANAAVTQPVSGGGYYVAGSIASGSVWFLVPTPTCAINENSTVFTGLQSAGVSGSSTTFASGVLSVCVAGLPGTLAIQYNGDTGTPVMGVQPGDKVVITFDHVKGTETLKDVTANLSGSIDIPDVSNQAGVFFGAHPANPEVPMLDGGKVTLSVTVDGGTLAAASPIKQSKRIGGISLTPSAISAKSGKAFTIREVDHNVA